MINARSLAYQILLHVNQRAAHPDRLIRAAFARHSRLDEREKALMTELTYGVLRWQGRLDWHIDQMSRTKPNKIAMPVRILLRLALYQIMFLDRVPAHAAVNEAVKLAKATQPGHLAGFVNGLLREAIRRGADWDWPSQEETPSEFLAVTTSHPVWFVRRCTEEMGFQETKALCEADNGIAPLVLRTNTLKTSTAALVNRLLEDGLHSDLSPHLPDSVRISGLRMDLARLPAFEEGWFQVQDEASQLVAHLVAPKPGERILDLCSGFGAKATHLAILMGNDGEIVAVDEAAWKLQDLVGNARRQGIGIIRGHAADALQIRPEEIGPFDRVLLDAPCSGFGTLRRNPDIRWKRHPKDPYRFSRLQESLLGRAAQFVAPGGVLVYATCTVFSEENEKVVERFVESHPDWTLEGAEEALPVSCRSLCEGGFYKTWPHRHDIDGFFGARLRRTG